MLLALAAASLLAARAAGDRTVAKTAQLDGDPAFERVERRFVDCPDELLVPQGPEQCGYIAIVDGDRTARLTATTQRPLFNYGWYPKHPVLLRDLTGDDLPELIWSLSTSGATSSSPRQFGVHRWAGDRAIRIFLHSQHRGSGRRSYILPVRLDVLPPREGLPELRVRDLLYERDDATCCPSFMRDRRYRFDGERMRLVPRSTRIRRTQAADR